MSALRILPAPDGEVVDLVKWLADMAAGASELQQVARGDPQLRIVTELLAMDLASISQAASDYVKGAAVELTEEPGSVEVLEAMERLLEASPPGEGSLQRAFAMAGIHWRLRQSRNAPSR